MKAINTNLLSDNNTFRFLTLKTKKMYRVIKMSGKFYAVRVNNFNSSEIQEIKIFIEESTPVILVDSLQDLEELGIDSDDVIFVNR